jgi:hypothetical protein
VAIKIFPVLLIIALSWTACKNDAAPADTTGTQSTSTTLELAPPADPNASMGSAPDVAIQPSTPQGATAGTSAGTPGINPPHGQPGHVCGTPVGSPLGGTATATKSVTPPTQVAPTSVTPKPAAAPTTTAPGMNPPHGQPGHVCGTPVGSPLDGKPKQ